MRRLVTVNLQNVRQIRSQGLRKVYREYTLIHNVSVLISDRHSIINKIFCETQVKRLYIPITPCRNVIQHMNTDETRCSKDVCLVEVVGA